MGEMNKAFFVATGVLILILMQLMKSGVKDIISASIEAQQWKLHVCTVEENLKKKLEDNIDTKKLLVDGIQQDLFDDLDTGFYGLFGYTKMDLLPEKDSTFPCYVKRKVTKLPEVVIVEELVEEADGAGNYNHEGLLVPKKKFVEQMVEKEYFSIKLEKPSPNIALACLVFVTILSLSTIPLILHVHNVLDKHKVVHWMRASATLSNVPGRANAAFKRQVNFYRLEMFTCLLLTFYFRNYAGGFFSVVFFCFLVKAVLSAVLDYHGDSLHDKTSRTSSTHYYDQHGVVPAFVLLYSPFLHVLSSILYPIAVGCAWIMLSIFLLKEDMCIVPTYTLLFGYPSFIIAWYTSSLDDFLQVLRNHDMHAVYLEHLYQKSAFLFPHDEVQSVNVNWFRRMAARAFFVDGRTFIIMAILIINLIALYDVSAYYNNAAGGGSDHDIAVFFDDITVLAKDKPDVLVTLISFSFIGVQTFLSVVAASTMWRNYFYNRVFVKFLGMLLCLFPFAGGMLLYFTLDSGVFYGVYVLRIFGGSFAANLFFLAMMTFGRNKFFKSDDLVVSDAAEYLAVTRLKVASSIKYTCFFSLLAAALVFDFSFLLLLIVLDWLIFDVKMKKETSRSLVWLELLAFENENHDDAMKKNEEDDDDGAIMSPSKKLENEKLLKKNAPVPDSVKIRNAVLDNLSREEIFLTGRFLFLLQMCFLFYGLYFQLGIDLAVYAAGATLLYRNWVDVAEEKES